MYWLLVGLVRSLKSSNNESLRKPLLCEDYSDLTSPTSNQRQDIHIAVTVVYDTFYVCLFVWVTHRFETSEVISRRCLLVAVVLWPMCCHTEMPCRRHRTRHPTPSQYTDTGPTCRCAIHWCGTSHWNTQLPILMSWVRPDREILPRPSTHTSERSTWCCHCGQQ